MGDCEENLLAKSMMRKMVLVLGMEIPATEAAGQLSREDRQQMIWRCDDCCGKSHCWNWLARSQEAGAPAEDPPHCPNRPSLIALKPEVEAVLPAPLLSRDE